MTKGHSVRFVIPSGSEEFITINFTKFFQRTGKRLTMPIYSYIINRHQKKFSEVNEYEARNTSRISRG